MKMRKKAFTLIELIVVIVIVGVLASVALPTYNSFSTQAKQKANQRLEKQINQFIDEHFLQGGKALFDRDTGLT